MFQVAETPVALQVNDVHSKLSQSLVQSIARPARPAQVVQAVESARREEQPLACCGGRHAMGGQQFVSGGILLDMGGMNRILDFNPDQGTLSVEAGIQWPELIQGYLALQEGSDAPWGLRQKQTGADRMSVGGSLAANIHGRVLDAGPLIQDVVSFQVVNAEGEILRCSREENSELFSLVIGGYGLFGVVTSVELQLVPRQKVERVVEIADLDGLDQRVEDRISAGYLYGDFQFVTDPRRDDFMRRGVFSCYKPVSQDRPIPCDQTYMTPDRWQALLLYAHTEKSRAFDEFAGFYLSTSGQVYWSDTHQLAYYLDDYHDELNKNLCAEHQGSEMITELYVPRHRLGEFMTLAAQSIRQTGADLIYGTVRMIRRDQESFLAWARGDFACVVLNLHVNHSPAGVSEAASSFRGLIDIALDLEGSYFLTYHRFASADQLETGYPQFRQFLRLKDRYDPDGVFVSDWYRDYAARME